MPTSLPQNNSLLRSGNQCDHVPVYQDGELDVGTGYDWYIMSKTSIQGKKKTGWKRKRGTARTWMDEVSRYAESGALGKEWVDVYIACKALFFVEDLPDKNSNFLEDEW